MIDINELRRLLQAATPGPWKMLPVGDGMPRFAIADGDYLSILTIVEEGGCTFGVVYADSDARYISAANPAAISEILDRLEAAEKERDDVAQQLVQAEIGKRKLEAECDELLAKIAQMERQEPVEWRTFDGEGGYDYRNFAGNEDYQAVWEARNPNHKGWVEPLYALPGAKGE